jgi:arginase family enzyme
MPDAAGSEDLEFLPPPRSFFGARRGGVESLNPGDLALIGMPTDWTHSSRIGARFGPRALRHETQSLIADLRAASSDGFYDTRLEREVLLADGSCWRDLGDAEVDPTHPERTTRAIADLTRGASLRGALPVAVGGDHYNGYPACLGVSEALAELQPGRNFGYIQIDGHLDFGDRLGAWGRLNHATNARRASELPNLSLANMVWIGIAGWVDGNDVSEIESAGGLIFTAEDIHRLGVPDVARRAIAHALNGCDTLYLSADIDALDSSFLPGTGSIVHSEVTPGQYLDLLTAFSDAPLCGIDFVEVAPSLDPSGRSERIAARLLLEAVRGHILKPAEAS